MKVIEFGGSNQLQMETKTDEKKVNVNRKTVASNLLWRFLERFGAYIVSFVVSIVLARILDPETYGTVAIMTVFISFFDVFVTGGFATSLIRDKKATEKDFNTVFWFNIIFSLILYLILFFASPFISNYYDNSSLKWLIRISAITLLINGVKNLQYAYIAKNLEFRKFFFATIGGTIASAIVGIVMAVNGMGAWALVAQGLVNYFVDVFILWIIIKWKPRFEFDFKLLKKHISFGWKILFYKILYTISNNIRQLVIGKKYSESDLAFYNRGKTYPNIIGQNIYTSVNSVIFPVLTRAENNHAEFNKMVKQAFKVNMFVMLPLMVGFFCVAESFVQLLLGSKWLPCVPYIQLFCAVVLFNSIEAIFSSTPMALGKSTASMFLGITECLVNLCLLFASIPFGPMAIGISMLVSTAFNCLMYMIYIKKVTGFKIFDCILSSIDSFVSTILMAILVIAIQRINLPYYIVLLLQVSFGILSYYFLNKFINNDAMPYCLSLVKDFLPKSKKAKSMASE